MSGNGGVIAATEKRPAPVVLGARPPSVPARFQEASRAEQTVANRPVGNRLRTRRNGVPEIPAGAAPLQRLCCDNGGTRRLLHEIPAGRPCGIIAAPCPEIAKKHANLLHRRAGLAAGQRAGLNPEHLP